MPATTYEYRFRDPEFVAIWQRWQDARSAWRKAMMDVPFVCFKEQKGFFDPDPALIPDGSGRAAAVEFLAARTAYKAKLAEYPEEET